ncbi:hypothetical protein L6452_06168 [Arctium lappa]|uniref:Uncharacterized protein n=1 Tax=Arctium lappa TaxID=4217 RepID=A0ACB9EIR4_ARCLA|nr:hypothetical protein L6452_06168 [Arctium lappa]
MYKETWCQKVGLPNCKWLHLSVQRIQTWQLIFYSTYYLKHFLFFVGNHYIILSLWVLILEESAYQLLLSGLHLPSSKFAVQ